MLEKLYFPLYFRSLIMNCVTTSSFRALINGFPTEEFKSERSLRQGDPLASFLFMICAEGLSSLIRRASLAGRLKGLQIGDPMPIITPFFLG